jgi:hypothetical protein
MAKTKMTGRPVPAVGELSERRGERRPDAPAVPAPDPEVPAKPTRRRFAAEYKLRVLREAEKQSEPGAVGPWLRRERLYSTHLTFRR